MRFLIAALLLPLVTLYGQSSYTFTNCGASGRFGPSQTNVNNSYTSGNSLHNQVSINTQGFQEWTVPTTGTYRIQAFGAQGGEGANSPSSRGGGGPGGLGARVEGDFSLNAGDVLVVVVGQEGQDGIGNGNCGGGGGGGSFVWLKQNNTLLLAAGGGGGGPGNSWQANTTIHGTSSTSGQTPPAAVSYVSGQGGTNGQGGGAGSQGGNSNCGYCGAGGAGWLSNGAAGGQYGDNFGRTRTFGFIGGRANNNLTHGGFGGGAATGDDGRSDYSHGNAGGGGYSGGGGTGYPYFGGGGGSFNSGANTNDAGAVRSGHGQVLITEQVCQGIPNAGTVDVNGQDTLFFCSPSQVTLSVQGAASGSGISYQWQSSGGPFGPWQNIPGATNLTHVANVQGFGSFFRLRVSCSGSGQFAFSNRIAALGDQTPPTISAPADLLQQPTDSGNCSRANLNLGQANANDNCQVASVSNNAPASFPLGITQVVWTVTDGFGLTATDTQTVEILDLEAPIMAQASPLNLQADPGGCSATNTGLTPPSTTENCQLASVNNNAPASFPAGVTQVEWVALDAAGNADTIYQTVVVTDGEAPQMGPAPTDTLFTDPGQCTASQFSLNSPSATDNCGALSLTNNAPSILAEGVHAIVWTATDSSGNSSQTTQLVVVIDNEAPQLQAPNDISIAADPGACTASNVNLGQALTSDNCGIGQVVNNAPVQFALGQTMVVWTLADQSGNVVTDTQYVTVSDQSPPSLSAPQAVQFTVDSASCLLSQPALGQAVANDACSPVAISNDAQGSYGPGVYTITWTASDTSGNTTTAQQTLTVTDNFAPIINFCAPDTFVCFGVETTLPLPSGTDNCSSALSTEQVSGPINGTIFPMGQHQLVFALKDAAQNAAYCTTMVDVRPLPNTSTNQQGTVLSAVQSGALYQWLDCLDNYNALAGETAQQYTPSSSGSYAVRVDLNGCPDTSLCLEVNLTGLFEANTQDFKIWPVPATKVLNIEVMEAGLFKVFDLRGALVMEQKLQKGTQQISLQGPAPGVYLIRFTGSETSHQQRLVIQP